jgi:biofilm PGA synthesis N-glycosyltransferase PgaC
MKYVLISPARNEEMYIQKTIESMVSQSVMPERWIIVDDGSTDRTAEIVEPYLKQYPWIQLVRRPRHTERSFAGKANAFNAGYEVVKSLQFDVIGNLDVDISFDSDYMEFLLQKFVENPKLGVAGTAMREDSYDALKDSFYNDNDVFGACQLFRRACFQDVGGYTPIKWGGLDWIAVRTARLRGWQTRSFTEKIFFHHRPMGATESNVWKARFDYGRKDYYLGNHPVWQFLRVGFQMLKRPYVLGAVVLLFGYFYSFSSRMKRPLTRDLVRLHRREQMERLQLLFGQFVKTGKLQKRS